MRKLLLILTLLLCIILPCSGNEGVSGNGMSIGGEGRTTPSHVTGSDVGTQVNATHIHLTMTNTTVGDLLVVGFSVLATYNPPIVGVGTFEDDQGNTWTRIANSDRTGLYYCIAKNDNDVVITATVGGSQYLGIAGAAFQNVTTADGSNNATTTSADVHHGNIGPTTAAGVVVGYMCQTSTTVTIDQDANWTGLIYEYENGSSITAHAMAYRLTSIGSYNDGWTLGASKLWYASGVAFK